MITAKVFRSGNSQAVRLPKEFRFGTPEVEIFRRGDEVVLREKRQGMESALEALRALPEDVFSEMKDRRPAQQRRSL